jgi:hypothetical protein
MMIGMRTATWRERVCILALGMTAAMGIVGASTCLNFFVK